MFGQKGGGIVGKGAACEFLAFFWSNSPPLGLENCSNPITYPFLRFRKPRFGAKFVIDKVVTNAPPMLYPPSQSKHKFVPASQGCALAEPGGRWCRTFALGWLENLSFLIQIIC